MSRKDAEARVYPRALALSLIVAGAAHAGLVLWIPIFHVIVPERTRVRIGLEMRFPLPEILDSAIGSGRAESTLAFAATPQLIDLVKHWPAPYRAYNEGGSASLTIQVDSLGRVLTASIMESSGDPLKDAAFEQLAMSFRYRLPSYVADDARVELLQRMSVAQLPVDIELRLGPSP